jgi:hypothetical protein
MSVFWLIAIACGFLVALIVYCNLGVFALSWRAKLPPSYAPLVRAVLGLIALFVLPRVQPYPVLTFGLALVVILGEAVTRVQQRLNRGEV